MADTLTLQIDQETAANLRRLASEAGESVEAFAQRLLEEAAADLEAGPESQLSDEQLEDLERRLKDPGPFATSEEVELFFARFKA